MQDDRYSERTLAKGAGARIVAVVDKDGRCQVADFLEWLADKRPKEFAKIQALLDCVKDVGPQGINNSQRVKPLGDGLFEFKAHQVRLFWIYGPSRQSQRLIVVLRGVVKKRDRHDQKDMKRAMKVKNSYEQETRP